jgi:hypothetical protein
MSKAYHSHPAWSPTKLKAAVTGSMKAWYHKHGPNAKPFKPTVDMIKGSLVDALLTPPFKLPEDEYLVVDTVDQRSKAGKANVALAAEQGLTPVTEDMIARAKQIKEALLMDPDCGPILESMLTEYSQSAHFWDDEYGRPCRCLPDVVTRHGLYDLKKARSADPRKLYWQSQDLAYDLQLAHLELGHIDRHGEAPHEVGIIGFDWPDDPEAPVETCILILSAEDLRIGRNKREEAFARISECQRTGIWPSYGRQPFRTIPENDV